VSKFNSSGNLTQINDLVNQARIAHPSDFLRLIEQVTILIKKEQKVEKSSQVEGRLFHLAPFGKAIIIGDLHGDLGSLTHIIEDGGFLEKVQKSEDVYLIFLGDYGDRGTTSPEVYYVILKLKELFPNKVILMRGNHEGPENMLPYPHDLPIQLKQKYDEDSGTEIMGELRRLFNYLYTTVIIDERAILIHGGLPSKATSIRDLACAHENHPREPHLEEMLWSDPKEELKGTQRSPRGVGKLFGIDITKKITKLAGVNVLIRSHEASPEGFKINHEGRVLTIFSTNKPPYDKCATYLQIDLSSNFKDANSLKEYIKQFKS
jgi:protein phosphatase